MWNASTPSTPYVAIDHYWRHGSNGFLLGIIKWTGSEKTEKEFLPQVPWEKIKKFIRVYPQKTRFIHNLFQIIHSTYPQVVWISSQASGSLPVIDRFFNHIQELVERIHARLEIIPVQQQHM